MGKPLPRIDEEILRQTQLQLENARNLKKAEKLFSNFDSKLNEVGKYLDKLPANATVRPKKSWLNIFGIE